MGYQESFITTSNKKYFNNFIKRIKIIGKEFYIQHNVYPTHIINIKENIYGIYEEKILLKKNKSYIYFCGERFLQRRSNRILNVMDKNDKDFCIEDDVTNTSLETNPFALEIIFAEEIDCAKIFDTRKSKNGVIYKGLNNKWLEVLEFSFLFCIFFN